MTNKTGENPKTAQNPQNHDDENISHSQKSSSEHSEHKQTARDTLKERRPTENENQQDEPTDRRKAS